MSGNTHPEVSTRKKRKNEKKNGERGVDQGSLKKKPALHRQKPTRRDETREEGRGWAQRLPCCHVESIRREVEEKKTKNSKKQEKDRRSVKKLCIK